MIVRINLARSRTRGHALIKLASFRFMKNKSALRSQVKGYESAVRAFVMLSYA